MGINKKKKKKKKKKYKYLNKHSIVIFNFMIKTTSGV